MALGWVGGTVGFVVKQKSGRKEASKDEAQLGGLIPAGGHDEQEYPATNAQDGVYQSTYEDEPVSNGVEPLGMLTAEETDDDLGDETIGDNEKAEHQSSIGDGDGFEREKVEGSRQADEVEHTGASDENVGEMFETFDGAGLPPPAVFAVVGVRPATSTRPIESIGKFPQNEDPNTDVGWDLIDCHSY